MNRATHIIAATLGVIFAISGMSHGFFEVLQGNTSTNGLFINAIGETHQFWEHGAEPAFTILPNFLITGIAAMVVAVAIIIWSIGFLHTRYGATVFLLLFILLFLVGGGVAQVILFITAWAVATRIHKPLTWWQRILPERIRGGLARIWPWTLGLGSMLFLLTLEIATFGYFPGVTDPDQVLNIMLASLGLGFALYLLSCIAGFADDIERSSSRKAVTS